jgi:hypothetical protein
VTTALLWAAPFLILAGCAAYAWCVLAGHERPGCLRRTVAARVTRALLRAAIAILTISPVRAAVVRVRWAWRCRGCPPPVSEFDPLDRDDMRAFIAVVRAWRRPAAPERSRT